MKLPIGTKLLLVSDQESHYNTRHGGGYWLVRNKLAVITRVDNIIDHNYGELAYSLDLYTTVKQHAIELDFSGFFVGIDELDEWIKKGYVRILNAACEESKKITRLELLIL